MSVLRVYPRAAQPPWMSVYLGCPTGRAPRSTRSTMGTRPPSPPRARRQHTGAKCGSRGNDAADALADSWGCRLREKSGDAALSLNRLGVRVMTGGDRAAPVLCGGTTCVLDSTAHRAGDRHIHAPVTGPAIRRRVIRGGPHRRGCRNGSRDHAQHDEHPAAVARTQRICRRSLAPVDRWRPLRPANSITSR